MQNELIVAPPIGAAPKAPEITPEGEVIKRELLFASHSITKIEHELDRDYAIQVAGKIKGHVSAVEKTRKEIKDPFYKMGQLIDATAKAHVTQLQSDLDRLNNLIGQFEADRQALLRKAAQEAEEARQKALREQEALKADVAQGEAPVESILSAELDAQEARERAEFLKAQAELAARNRPSGGSTRTEIDIIVDDIHALYLSAPQCVKLEPRLAEIKLLIEMGVPPKGVTFSKRAVFATRGVAPTGVLANA